MFQRIREDIQTVFAKDPAARSTLEVITSYPGLHAIWLHRLAHFLWTHRWHFPARFLSHLTRFFTGIEIHPGATIGRRFFIDHGMGIVIGETAEIGDDVLMYQGVVLGGTSHAKTKRHPTVEDHVVIGAGAIVLGPITIGKGARVGAGSVVVKSVPPGVTVVGVPARISGPKAPVRPDSDLSHHELPDPGLQAIVELLSRHDALESRVKKLENRLAEQEAPAAEAPSSAAAAAETLAARIRAGLREVLDPEAGINVVDLGLIRRISVNENTVEVQLVYPEDICPIPHLLVDLVRRKTEDIVGETSGRTVHVVMLGRRRAKPPPAPD